MCAEEIPASAKMQGSSDNAPSGARLSCVVAKDDIDIRHSSIRVARLFISRALQPYATRPGFPVLVPVGDVTGIQRTDRDADDNLIFGRQLLFVLATDVEVCARCPRLAQV